MSGTMEGSWDSTITGQYISALVMLTFKEGTQGRCQEDRKRGNLCPSVPEKGLHIDKGRRPGVQACLGKEWVMQSCHFIP